MTALELHRLSRYKKKPSGKKKQIFQKAIGYVRVSTDGQEDNTSLTVQTEAIKNYCLAKNLQLEDVYTDVASGGSFDRPEFKKMRARILADDSQIDALILFKLDRLSRSVVDGYSFIVELENSDISIISISENIDNSTPTGQAMLQLIFTFAEMERKVITERMVSGRRQKLKNGDKPAGQIFGYEYGERKQLKVVEKEAKKIRYIFQTYEKYQSLALVKKNLDAYQIYNRRRKKFSRQAIHYLLTNIFYVGSLVYENGIIPGNHQAIIPTNKFERIQEILLEKRRSY